MLVTSFYAGRLRMRSAEQRDQDVVLRWRNSLRAREAFWHTEAIDEETHHEWFSAQLIADNAVLLIAEDDAGPIGQASIYDIAGAEGTFGRFLVGEDRALGKRCGTRIALGAMAVAKQLELRHLKLTVRPENVAARRIYQVVGFEQESETRFCCDLKNRHWERWDSPGVVEDVLAAWNSQGEIDRLSALTDAVQNHRVGDDLLEAGCASGRVATALVSRGQSEEKYLGVDTSFTMLAAAIANHSWIKVQVGDVFRLPFEDGAFSNVLCTAVLGHLPNWKEPLKELCRVASRRVMFTIWPAKTEITQPHVYGGESFIYKLLPMDVVQVEASKYGSVEHVQVSGHETLFVVSK